MWCHLLQFNPRSQRLKELKRRKQKEGQKRQRRQRSVIVVILVQQKTKTSQETKEDTQEDILAEKLRLQELQKESDLQVAKELFGMTGCGELIMKHYHKSLSYY